MTSGRAATPLIHVSIATPFRKKIKNKGHLYNDAQIPAMQGFRRYLPLTDGGVRLELTTTTTSPLSIDVAESTQMRIQRLVSENPVIIFSTSACCMCHVMRRLLSTIGVHPTVIELEEDEIGALSAATETAGEATGNVGAPALFIGGGRVGGLEGLVALHLRGHLVPKLIEVGALRINAMVL